MGDSPQQRTAGQALDVVVASVKVDRIVPPRGLDDLDRLGQSVDALGGPIEGQTQRIVIGGHPPGADPGVKAPLGEGGHGGQLFGQDRRVTEIVGEDVDGGADGGSRLSQGEGCVAGRKAGVHVVAEADGVVAEVLHLAAEVPQLGGGRDGQKPRRAEPESEAVGVGVSHGRRR